jgi:hypothetical protein
MKLNRSGLLLAFAAAVGCATLPNLREEKTPPPPPPVAAKPARPVNPVAAEQITEANASEKVVDLWDELDRESAKDPAKP